MSVTIASVSGRPILCPITTSTSNTQPPSPHRPCNYAGSETMRSAGARRSAKSTRHLVSSSSSSEFQQSQRRSACHVGISDSIGPERRPTFTSPIDSWELKSGRTDSNSSGDTSVENYRSRLATPPEPGKLPDPLSTDDASKNSNAAQSSSNTPGSKDARDMNAWRSFRVACGSMVDDARVQLFIVGLIVINALLMGVATFDFVTDVPKVSDGFEATDRAILVVFTVEIGLQIIHHGIRKVLADGWLCFDLIVVVMSWTLESMAIVRALRVFRVLRLISRLRTLKKLVQALFEVTPAVSAIISLLLLIMYIYAVLCTALFGDLYKEGVTSEDYFGRLDRSLLTLLQFVTLDWADIAREVVSKYYWAWFVFTTFLVLTSIILYSLIVAVVCDAVSKSEHADDPPDESDVDLHAALDQIGQLQQRVAQLTHQQEHLSLALQLCLNEISTRTLEDDDGGFLSVSETSCSEGDELATQLWTGVAATGPEPVEFDVAIAQRRQRR